MNTNNIINTNKNSYLRLLQWLPAAAVAFFFLAAWSFASVDPAPIKLSQCGGTLEPMIEKKFPPTQIVVKNVSKCSIVNAYLMNPDGTFKEARSSLLKKDADGAYQLSLSLPKEWIGSLPIEIEVRSEQASGPKDHLRFH